MVIDCLQKEKTGARPSRATGGGLRSPVRFAVRMAAFAMAWTGFLFAAGTGDGLYGLSLAGIKWIDAVWLLLLADLIMALADKDRWRMGAGPPSRHSAQEIAAIRRAGRASAAKAAAVWAALLLGCMLALPLTPRGGEYAALASVCLLPVEAVFVRWRCPLRALTRSLCCRGCRLRDWGEAMTLTPLAAARSWPAAVLLALSAVILARGELLRRRHPSLLDPGAACAACPRPCARESREWKSAV